MVSTAACSTTPRSCSWSAIDLKPDRRHRPPSTTLVADRPGHLRRLIRSGADRDPGSAKLLVPTTPTGPMILKIVEPVIARRSPADLDAAHSEISGIFARR